MAGMAWKRVYLPKLSKGEVWYEVLTGRKYRGGQTVAAKAPKDRVPVFVKKEELIFVFEQNQNKE